MNVLRISGSEVQRIKSAQGEADYSQSARGMCGTLNEKAGCICDLSFSLQVVGVESAAKGFSIGDVICDLAMIEIWGKGNVTGFCQPIAVSLRDGSPP